jgi:hypothetical protein
MSIRLASNYHNPYKDELFVIEDSPTHGNENFHIHKWAEKITNSVLNILFAHDYEKRIDIIGIGAKYSNWGVTATVGFLQASLAACNYFRWHIEHIKFIRHFPWIITIIGIPTSIFFLAVGSVQVLAEAVRLKRVSLMLYQMEKNETPLHKIEWIQKKFFSLSKSESQRIYTYIESFLPHLTKEKKQQRFDKIAVKVLNTRYENLKRRISPTLALSVKDQLSEVLKELNSDDPAVRQKGEKRAEILIHSVTKQAKVQIVVHLIGITAIALSMISTACSFAGLFGLLGTVSFGLASTGLALLQLSIEKGKIEMAAEKLYEKLIQHELYVSQESIEASLSQLTKAWKFLHSWLIEDPSHSQILAQRG